MARGRGGLFLHLNPPTHPILIPNFANHPQVDSTSFRLALNRGLFGLTGVGRLTLRDCGRREPPERSTSKEHRHQFVWPPERWIAFMCPPLVALCDTAPHRFAWPPLPAPLSVKARTSRLRPYP